MQLQFSLTQSLAAGLVGDMGCPKPRYELPSLITIVNKNAFNAVAVGAYYSDTGSMVPETKIACGPPAKRALPKSGSARVNLDASAKTLNMKWAAPDGAGGWHNVISAPLFERGRNENQFLCAQASGWPLDNKLTLDTSASFPGPQSNFCDTDKHCVTLPGTTCVSLRYGPNGTTTVVPHDDPANYGFCCDAANCTLSETSSVSRTGDAPAAATALLQPAAGSPRAAPPSLFPASQCSGFPAPAHACAPDGPLGPSFFVEVAAKGMYYIGGVERLPCNGAEGETWVAVEKVADVSTYDESIIAATMGNRGSPSMVSIVKTAKAKTGCALRSDASTWNGVFPFSLAFHLAPIDSSLCDVKDTEVLALTASTRLDAPLFYAAQRKNATTTMIVQLNLTTPTTATVETLLELSFPDAKQARAVAFYLPDPTSGFYTIVHQIERDAYEIVLTTTNVTTKARRDQLFSVPNGIVPIGLLQNGVDDRLEVLYTRTAAAVASGAAAGVNAALKTRYSGSGLLGNGTLTLTAPFDVSLGKSSPVFAMVDATLGDASWQTWSGVGAKATFAIGPTGPYSSTWFFPTGPGVDGPKTPWYAGDPSFINGASKTVVLQASCTKC